MSNTPIDPTLQNPVPPDLRNLFTRLSSEIRKQINSARPGIIMDFNAANSTATVQIAQQQVTSVSPLGVRTLAAFSPLVSVPVYTLGGGGVTATFPIKVGDECIVLFCDREIDNWLNSGGTNTAPSSPRIHDLSDGICLVGIRSIPRELGGVSTTEAQLRTDDGLSFVGINPATQGVRVHAGTVYEWDVHGYGQKIQWMGGANYTITNYTLGATVSTVNAAINPPGPP